MPERQLLVRPLGLITQPNKLGQFPDGAMSQAQDVIFRAPGKLQQAYSKTAGWATLLAQSRLLYSTSKQLVSLQNSGSGWSVAWVVPSLTSPTVTTGSFLPFTINSTFSVTGRVQAITARGRTIINGITSGSVVADYEDPSSTAERTFRSIGMLQPTLKLVGSATGQAVAEGTIVAYGAVIKRVYADGYILRSRPSVFWRYFVAAGGGAKNVTWDVFHLPGLGYVREGDIVELYRTQSAPSNGTNDDDPGPTMYLAASKTISASDIAANKTTITDSAIASALGGPLGGLGEALYTNPDFGGLASSNDPPPTAASMATFRGRAWYANCTILPTVKWAYSGGIGTLSSAAERSNGVGLRAGTGTFASGNPTVTGISATDILGLAPGQRVFATHITGTVTILSVGASSFTMSANATGSGSVTWTTYDVLELDGSSYFVFDLVTNPFSGFLSANYIVNASRSLYDKFQSVVMFQVRRLRDTTSMAIRASNGDKYLPAVVSFPNAATSIASTTLKNYVRYSHDQQPEAVPSTNELWVGGGEIYAMVPTRDALWFFCSDGVFRLSGTIAPIDGVPDIRVDPIDSSLILASPRAWCVLRDRIYAYTNIGLMEISDEAIRPISMGVVGDLLPGQRWNEAETPFLVADSRTDEIYIIGAHASLNFVYSVRYGAFTTTAQFDSAQTGVQIATSLAMVFGYASTTLDELQPDLTTPVPTGPFVRADFQPLLCGRPDVLKQFIDLVYIFETGVGGSVRPRFNGVEDAVSQSIPAISGNDARLNAGVPCDAPAIGYSLAPGLRYMNTTAMQLSGLSIRYVQITEQQGARQ